MMVEKIIELVEGQGYRRHKFTEKSNYSEDVQDNRTERTLLDFEHVYADEELRESYVLVEKDELFTSAEVEQYEERVAKFVTRLPNGPLRYNINLVLICPLEGSGDMINTILQAERDKYYCRKIFVDSRNFDEDIAVLPILPIDVELDMTATDSSTLLDEIRGVLQDERLFEILVRERRDIDPELIADGIKNLDILGD